MALDTRRGRTYLSNSPGLEVLDTRSGQLLPNLPLGLPNIEDDMALDAGTDHLYIATRSRDEQLEVVRVRLPAGHPTQIVRLGPYPPPRPSQPCSPWTRRASGSTSPSGCESWYSTPQPAGRSRRSRCPSRPVSWRWMLPPGTCSWPARIHRAAAGRAVGPAGWHPSPSPRQARPQTPTTPCSSIRYACSRSTPPTTMTSRRVALAIVPAVTADQQQSSIHRRRPADVGGRAGLSNPGSRKPQCHHDRLDKIELHVRLRS